MKDFTLHANANAHERDIVFRVTYDQWDALGPSDGTQTWRGHDTCPRFEAPIDQAHALLVRMVLMLEKQGAAGRIVGVHDEPLF